MAEFPDVFTSSHNFGHYAKEKYVVRMNTDEAICSSPYCINPRIKPIIKEQIQTMMNQKVIEPANFGHCEKEKYVIRMDTDEAIYSRPYCINPRIKPIIEEQILTMMNQKVIEPANFGHCKKEKYVTRMDTDAAIYSRPYHISPRIKPIFEEQIQTMMNQKVIEPSNSTCRYGSNIVLVKKPKSDDWRFTINLKNVNKHVIADCYPVLLVPFQLNQQNIIAQLISHPVSISYLYMRIQEI